MPHLSLRSANIEIIATTLALLDAEEISPEALAERLAVAPPPVWPPEFNGQPYRDWQRALLSANPGEPGFAAWYVVGNGELVGTCGFKGPPDPHGAVEIGYSIIAPRRRLGFASGAVNLLLAHAFGDPRVETVLAETLPDGIPSQAVLARCGFVFTGTRQDPEDGQVLRFARSRL